MSLQAYRYPNKLNSKALYDGKPDVELVFSSIAEFRQWVTETKALLFANTTHPTNYVPVYKNSTKPNQYGSSMNSLEPAHPQRPQFGHELYLLQGKIIAPGIAHIRKDGELGSLDYEVEMDNAGTTR